MISRCLKVENIYVDVFSSPRIGLSKKVNLLNLLTMLARAVSSTICSKSELCDARSLEEQK